MRGSPEETWDRMDDLGYAGPYGSNKPAVTADLIQSQKTGIKSDHPDKKEEPAQLIPQNDLDRQRIAVSRLRPDGTYKRLTKRDRQIAEQLVDARMGKDWGKGRKAR